ETIYNPLSFRSEVKSDCKKNNILFVGRLVKQQKGLDLLIDAFKIIHNKQKDWNLNIVGDGPDKQWLIDKIHKENLINNTKIINVTNNMKKYYLDSSILVSTSRWEGFGLVITEAMECG
ncbi:glycosyltransferase, partial [Clostridium saudiense]|nr:glycosyltransferase [Clostridium saudiense]